MRPEISNERVAGSRVWKRRSRTPTSDPVSALRSVDLPALVYPASATVGRPARSRSWRIVPRVALVCSRRRRSCEMRSRASRRSVSIWDSPGPRVPMPPSMRPAPRRSRWVQRPAHAREVVLELGELHLELALGRAGVVGEDVEDDRRAVDHRDVELLLEVALLARQQLVVAGHEVGAGLLDGGLDLLELAATEVAVGIGPVAALHQLAGDRHSRRAEQLAQLAQVRLVWRGADQERALARSAVADALAVAGLGVAAVAASVHRDQV